MTGYMERLGGNRKDKKTQAAYERFKTPPYYMNFINKGKDSKKG